MEQDYYKILGLDKNATIEEIKKAFRKKCFRLYPGHDDGSQDVDKNYKLYSEAYDILIDDSLRYIYDREGIDGIKKYRQENNDALLNFTKYFNLTK